MQTLLYYIQLDNGHWNLRINTTHETIASAGTEEDIQERLREFTREYLDRDTLIGCIKSISRRYPPREKELEKRILAYENRPEELAAKTEKIIEEEELKSYKSIEVKPKIKIEKEKPKVKVSKDPEIESKEVAKPIVKVKPIIKPRIMVNMIKK